LLIALPREGVEIILVVKSAEPIKLRLVEQSYGLAASFGKNPGNPATQPPPYNDSTFMSKSFLF